MIKTILQGFLFSGSLIVAIGAQNAFVLKQGLLKEHTFWIALTCFLCDFVLITIGVLGLGSLIGASPLASLVLSIVGALFLFVYGLRAFTAAYKGDRRLLLDDASQKRTVLQTILLTLAITLLNPHVYLDTVVIIGSIAGTLNAVDKILFLIGAIAASGLWFFGLAYAARLLIPFFQRPIVWRMLDFSIGIIMWLIAAGLVKYAMMLNA